MQQVTDPWLLTVSGKHFSLLHPKPEDVDIEDIAHALAQTCRFTGHTRTFYTVAEHCVLVALILREQGYDADMQLAGLFHDAAEAYIGDVSTPLKWALDALPDEGFIGGSTRGLREIEHRVNEVIGQKFQVNMTDDRDIIKTADLIALATEARDLVGDIQYPADLKPYQHHIEIALLWAQWLYTGDLSVVHSPATLYRMVFARLIREAYTVA